MDHEKVMVWTFAMSALLQRGENPINAGKTADDAVKEFEKRQNDGFFRDKDERCGRR